MIYNGNFDRHRIGCEEGGQDIINNEGAFGDAATEELFCAIDESGEVDRVCEVQEVDSMKGSCRLGLVIVGDVQIEVKPAQKKVPYCHAVGKDVGILMITMMNIEGAENSESLIEYRHVYLALLAFDNDDSVTHGRMAELIRLKRVVGRDERLTGECSRFARYKASDSCSE